MKSIVLILISVLLLTGCNSNKNVIDNPVADNQSQYGDAVKDKIIYGNSLKIYNIEVKKISDTEATYSFSIQNVTNEDIDVKSLKLYFKDKDGNFLLKNPEYINVRLNLTIKSGETVGNSIMLSQTFDNLAYVDYQLSE